MKFTKKDKKRAYMIFGVIFIAIFAMQMGWLQGVGIAPSPYLPAYQSGYEIPVGTEVYCKITTRTLLGLATSDLAVNMYSDAAGLNWIDTCTTNAGIGTFTGQYPVGTSVWLQGRQAAVASADPYVTPLTEFIVSPAGESADTVVLKNAATGVAILWVKDVVDASTGILFNVTEQTGAAIWDAEHGYLNTTDTSLRVSVTITTTSTYYGADSFKDAIPQRSYDGGVFFIYRGTVLPDWETAPLYQFNDLSNYYCVWKIADQLFYDPNGNVGARSVTAVLGLNVGSTFGADATVVLDICDMIDMQLLNTANMFIDGGTAAPTAITTKVA